MSAESKSLRAVVVYPDYWPGLKDISETNTRVAPDKNMLGVPLTVRTLRQLQDNGVTKSTLILPFELSKSESTIKNDWRLTHTVEFVYAENPSDANQKISEAIEKADGNGTLICRSDLICPAKLIEDFLSECDSESICVAGRSIEPPPAAPTVVMSADSWKLDPNISDANQMIGIIYIDAKIQLPEDMPAGIRGILSSEGRLINVIQVSTWWHTVRVAADISAAESKLLLALRKPIDGIVARTINRHISIPISRRLVNTPVTPNMSSAFTVLVAITSVFCVVQGGYFWTLVGALLFQIASIIDGVDGELARLRYQFSKFGEWFDTVSDDISNYLFFAALTYTIYAGTNGPPWLLGLGILTVFCYTFITPLMYSYIIMYTDSGDVMAIDYEFNKSDSLKADSFLVRFFAGLKYVAKRDFFIFTIFVFAVFGILPYMLILTGIASPIILVTTARQHLQKRKILAN